ncbi:MAG: hypothetical protein M3619_13180 [Myxococcota bacterium]|nr:hypothetical protein [Myxococcota bacterium]
MRAVPCMLFIAASLVACAVEEPATSVTTQGVTSSNKIALNKIALNKIALNKIALNKIALNKIALNKIALNSLSTQALLDNNVPGGREILEYLVSCAFPENVTLVGTPTGGSPIEFRGSIGLAPRWETRQLTLKEKRWVSACMLARVSNSGTPLFISLRGNHDSLTVSASEAANYDYEEGAFYGDIFTPEGEDIVALTCRGSDLASGNGGATFTLRQCAESNDGVTSICGMQWAGDCAKFDTSWACDESGEYYGRCHDHATADGKWRESIHARYEEVITVFVTEQPLLGP